MGAEAEGCSSNNNAIGLFCRAEVNELIVTTRLVVVSLPKISCTSMASSPQIEALLWSLSLTEVWLLLCNNKSGCCLLVLRRWESAAAARLDEFVGRGRNAGLPLVEVAVLLQPEVETILVFGAIVVAFQKCKICCPPAPVFRCSRPRLPNILSERVVLKALTF